MPPLRKPALFKLFEDALRRSGLSFLRLSGEGEHPASYQIMEDAGSYRARVYIWNLTFGGRVALPDEWRIQVTGLPEVGGGQRFVPEVGGKTIILGWCEELGVFAAYDVNKHLGVLGGSPSIQIRQPAVEAARLNGLAAHFKGEEEVAFASFVVSHAGAMGGEAFIGESFEAEGADGFVGGWKVESEDVVL